VKVPFTPGRNDATQEQTDVESFATWSRSPTASATTREVKFGQAVHPAEHLLIDKADLLTLTAPR